MSTTAILGTQWGDEGKGKICHMLAEDSDWVVRFNGGPNAGHTVVDDEGEIKFHHLPSGSLYEHCNVVLGNGMVVNPIVLAEELDKVEEQRGIHPNVYIAGNLHLIMAYHPVIEALERSKEKVGTTGRGIGPTYQDKAARSGFRFWDLLADDFSDRFLSRLEELRERWNHPRELEEIDEQQYLNELQPAVEKISEYEVINVSQTLNEVISEGHRVMFEGAQGALLDIDYGTYPFVTSSNPTIGGISTGAGVPSGRVERVIGIVKAYTTRVGKGPMITEETGSIGEQLREQGDEYGATTGRPRRCGWLDLVGLRYTATINNLTEIALTKLDVLSGFDEIKVADSYQCDGGRRIDFPVSLRDRKKCSANYITLEGWDEDISDCRERSELPTNAQDYVDMVERRLEVPVNIISIGPDKKQTIVE